MLPLPIPTISMTEPPTTPKRPFARRAQTVDSSSLLGTPSSFLSPGTPPETAGMNFELSSSPLFNEPAVRGLLLGYSIVGTITYAVMVSLGEMVAYLPIPGGHIALARRFVDSAFSFTMVRLFLRRH